MDRAANQTRKSSKSASKSRERGSSATNKGKPNRKTEESAEKTTCADIARSKSKSQEGVGSKVKRRSLSEKEDKSSKCRERPPIDYNENGDKDTMATESNYVEDFDFDPVYQKYFCLYCPNSFHPSKQRARNHSKSKKHQLAQENAVHGPYNKVVSSNVKSPKEAKKNDDKNNGNDCESSPKEKAAKKRGRQKKINQTEIHDVQDEPAGKRNRRKPKQFENCIDPEDLSEHINDPEELSEHIDNDKSASENLPVKTKKSAENINSSKEKVVQASHKSNKPIKKRGRPTSKKAFDKENIEEMSEAMEENQIVVQKKRQKIRVENPLKKRALENITQDQNVSLTLQLFLI